MTRATLINILRTGGVLACVAVAALTLQRGHTEHKIALPTTSARADVAALTSPGAGTRQTLADSLIATLATKVQQDSHNPKLWADLGDALMQKARETADSGYYTRAEAAYRKTLDYDPKNLTAILGMAWVNGGRHEFEQSISWAQKAVALDPKCSDAYGLMSDADIEMGNYDDALTHCQQMLDIRPDLASYGRGAHLLWLTGDTRKAVLLMVKAIDAGGPFAENTVWCRTQLGLILFNYGSLPAAERTLEATYKVAPNNYQTLAALARVKAARKNYTAAIDLYKRSIAIVPTHDALVALGDLYRLTHRPDEAAKQDTLVESIHQLQKANGVRGDLQIARFYADHDRNLPEALALAQAEYTTRKNVLAADTLAWCYYKNGRYTEARELIQHALSRNTPDASIRFHAGMIYAKLGDRVRAQNTLYQALSLNPNFSPVDAPVAVATIAQLGSRPPVSVVAER